MQLSKEKGQKDKQ